MVNIGEGEMIFAIWQFFCDALIIYNLHQMNVCTRTKCVKDRAPTPLM